MASQAFVTPEEYLEYELRTEHRHEYLNGEIFAMSGGSLRHNDISQNINGSLWGQLKGTPCRVHSNDLRVATSGASMFTYPDIVVFCGKPRLQQHKGTDTLLNPIFILEILSPSTENYDRRKKFQMYREIATLQEYAIVSQEKVFVERFVRQASGDWQTFPLSLLTDSFTPSDVPATLKLAEIYEGV